MFHLAKTAEINVFDSSILSAIKSHFSQVRKLGTQKINQEFEQTMSFGCNTYHSTLLSFRIPQQNTPYFYKIYEAKNRQYICLACMTNAIHYTMYISFEKRLLKHQEVFSNCYCRYKTF